MRSASGIEALIEEAIARGEFDHLPGKGKPLDLSQYFDTPEHLRVAYMLLKNAGYLPAEVELLREIEALQEAAATVGDESKRKQIRREMAAKKLKLDLLLERLKPKRRGNPAR